MLLLLHLKHMTPTQKQHFETLLSKAYKLTELNKKMAQKVATLEVELAKTIEKTKEQEEVNQKLTEQIKIIKLAQNISQDQKSGADVSELKRKINEYIKEIDSCIVMLND